MNPTNKMTMGDAIENIYGEEYFHYLKNRGLIRKLVRKIYLNDIRKYCIGKTIDFGCGVGELLKILPEGSVGFEVNRIAIEYCRSAGLQVEYYDPVADDYQLSMIQPGMFFTFTMNHVLEHLDDSQQIIKKIFSSCHRLGIKRIVFTVPGTKGFKLDKTHQTFIDKNYLQANGILDNKLYSMKVCKYFPVNWSAFSRYFTHNELRLVWEKAYD
jgi:hypothetical protein